MIGGKMFYDMWKLHEISIKVFWEHSHTPLMTFYLWVLYLRSCNRDHLSSQNLLHLLSDPLRRKFC